MVKIILALLILSLIIVVHELGHFLLAKKNGIGVVEFSLGMGPRLFSVEKNDTKYSLKLLPIGGSCMMVGEDEDSDADNAFGKQSVWARMSVIVAGPFFNFILAFLLSLIYIGNSGWDYAKIKEVSKDMPAQEEGLQEGDIVTKIGDYNIWSSTDLQTLLSFNRDAVYKVEKEEGDEKIYKPIPLKVTRDGKEKTFNIRPVSQIYYSFAKVEFGKDEDFRIFSKVEEDSTCAKAGIKVGDKIVKIDGKEVNSSDDFVEVYNETEFKDNVDLSYERDGEVTDVNVELTASERGVMGFTYKYMNEREKVSALNVIKYSFVDVGCWIKCTVNSIKWLLTGKVSKDNVSGVVGIVDVIGDSYEATKDEGAIQVSMNLIYIAILLTANLGVMNLIPFPALDGGRFVLLLYEAITRKKVKQEVEGVINLIGFAILMILMVFVTWNDISRIISG